MKELETLRSLADYLDAHYVSPMRPHILYLTKETSDNLKSQFNEGYTAIYTPEKKDQIVALTQNPVDTYYTVYGYKFAVIIADENSLLWDAIVAKHNVASK